MHIIKAAKDIKVGDQIPENDGFLFEVIKTETTGSETLLTLASDFSSHPKFHKSNGGVTQVFPKNELLYVAA